MLKPTGNTGDVIRNSLKMAEEEGFASVAKKWIEQTISYNEAVDILTDQKRERQDITSTVGDVSIGVEDGFLVVYHSGKLYRPTEHAWNQMCLWFDVPKTMFQHYTQPKTVGYKQKYTRDDQDLALLRNAFKIGHRRIDPNKEFLFRTYSDGTLRAMLSDRYDIVDNVWYLEQLQELIPGGRVSHFNFSDADTVLFNVLIPDTIIEDNDGDYGGMVSASNCEIGTRRFSQFPSVFRSICMNGCIYDQNIGTKYSKKHVGIDLNDLQERLASNIATQIPLMGEGVKRFLSLRDKKIEKTIPMYNVFAQIGLENRWTPKQAREVGSKFVKYEKENTLFHVVNSITRAGQEFNRDVWYSFDTLAGRLLNFSENDFLRLKDRAKTLSEKDLEKVYGASL